MADSGSQAKQDNVVILHHPGRGPWAPSMIPFAVKLETYLRMAKIPFKGAYGLKSSPKGKFPWIEYKGNSLGDTAMIIKFLNKEFGVDLNKDLNKEQCAAARAIQALTEDHLYWTGLCMRWLHHYDRKLLTDAMGFPISLITWQVSRTMKKYAWAQGMGRHSVEEIIQFMKDDLQLLCDFIGDKKFLTGSTPCEADCAVFGSLSQVRWDMPGTGEVKMIEEEYPILAAYCDRMKDTFWPDWDECITHGGTRKASK